MSAVKCFISSGSILLAVIIQNGDNSILHLSSAFSKELQEAESFLHMVPGNHNAASVVLKGMLGRCAKH